MASKLDVKSAESTEVKEVENLEHEAGMSYMKVAAAGILTAGLATSAFFLAKHKK